MKNKESADCEYVLIIKEIESDIQQHKKNIIELEEILAVTKNLKESEEKKIQKEIAFDAFKYFFDSLKYGFKITIEEIKIKLKSRWKS